MLHIGDKDINLAVQGAGVLYVGSRKMGPIINESGEPTPGGTVLHLYDRVDGKATVAGFWTDGNGQRYAVCVADAQYRSGGKLWSTVLVDTSLPNYSSPEAALAAGESGTWNTDTILNNYTPTDYPAFNVARNACTVSVDDKNFTSCLPNLKELQMIWNDKATLDTYDTTLTDYPNNSLSNWHMGGRFGICWSSNENTASYAYDFYYDGTTLRGDKADSRWGAFNVIPIIEIPVDENGRVITN